MPYCALASCENATSDSNSLLFHRFPLGNKAILEKWITSMKFSELNPPLSGYICEVHFKLSCYERGRLKRDAVPSLDIDIVNNNSVEVDNDDENMRVTGQESLFEQNYGVFLCRVCATKLNEEEMQLIFENSSGILEKIKCCLPIAIENYDDLPLHICENCTMEIENIFKFRSMAVVTETMFSRYLTNPSDSDKTNTSQDSSKKQSDKIWLDELPLEGPITCNLCCIEFTDMVQFDKHTEGHGDLCERGPVGLLNLVCSTCGLIFESDMAYKEHKRYQKFECNKCEFIIYSFCEKRSHDCQKNMFNYMFNLEDIETMQNIIDDNSFTAISKQNELISRRNEDKKNNAKDFRCNICDRKFLRHINLAKHKARHMREDQGDFRCRDCDEQFPKLRQLTQHREKVHRVGSTWVCRFCGKHTTTKLSLNIHERIHTGIKPFICEWCGNAFRSKANLSQHHAKHTGIRRHACPVCGKMFSRKSFVTTHLRVHTGERPYACEICEQRFTQIGDMRRHRRRHNIESVSMAMQPFLIEEVGERCESEQDITIENSENSIILESKLGGLRNVLTLNAADIIITGQ